MDQNLGCDRTNFNTNHANSAAIEVSKAQEIKAQANLAFKEGRIEVTFILVYVIRLYFIEAFLQFFRRL